MTKIRARASHSPYLGFSAIMFGLFTLVSDQGAVIVALPSIAERFGSDLPTTQWVLVGFALAISVTLLPMGRLADLVGRKRVYMAGMIVVVISCVAAGAAPSMPLLIGANVVHGIGAGMTQGTSMAMVVSSFPQSQRGRALGLYMGVVGAGSVFGPAVGGVVIGAFGWVWVFFGVALMSAVSLSLTATLVDSERVDAGRGGATAARFDKVGAALSAGTLIVFLQAMTWAPEAGYGSPYILLAFGAALALAFAFVAWELRAQSPMLDLRLFRIRTFTVGVASAFIHFIGSSSAWFLMPFYIQVVLRHSPQEVGMITALSSVSMAVMGPVSGWLSERFGRRLFTAGGLGVTTIGMLTLATLGTDSRVEVAVVGMVLQSVGIGAFIPPNNGAVLNSVGSDRHGVVSGFLQLVRNSANVISVTLAATIVTLTMGSMGYPPSLAVVSESGDAGLLEAFVAGLRYSYLLMAALLTLGILIVVTGPRARARV